jgi:hypothetical protein
MTQEDFAKALVGERPSLVEQQVCELLARLTAYVDGDGLWLPVVHSLHVLKYTLFGEKRTES